MKRQSEEFWAGWQKTAPRCVAVWSFFGGGNGRLVGVERDAGNSFDGRMFRTGGVAGLYGAVEVRAITVHFRLYLCEGRGSQVLQAVTEQIHDLLVVFN